MSRLIVYLLIALLVGVLGGVVLKQNMLSENTKDEVQLISIEKALSSSKPTNIRTNATVSIDSCKEAESAFGKLANKNSLSVGDNITKDMLKDVLEQFMKEESTETHLSCLSHRLSLTKR